ncbi:MAG: FecR family protein [Chitinophagales bacterium]
MSFKLKMGQEHIWNLIAKKLSGEASGEELRELQDHLRSNPEFHYPMQTVADLWHSSTVPDTEDAQQAFDRHIERMQRMGICFSPEPNLTRTKKRKKNQRNILLSGIAGALVFAGLFLTLKILNGSSSSQKTTFNDDSEVSTRNGSRTNLSLPDGTTVWLNGGSKLSYDKNYGNNLREVSLTGEAFFDVVKNGEKPFIIHTGKINIRVLGTAFNVKSYPGEKTIETSLIRGSIEVTFEDRPAEKVILKPNEKLIVANEEIPVALKKQSVRQNNEPIVAVSHLNFVKSDNSIAETAWTQNKLIFQDKSFKDLATEMERWYGVNIRFDNSQRDTLRFTGSFENETIQQSLDALKLAAGKSVPDFHYTIRGNEIMISK